MSILEILGFATGQLGLSPEDFGKLTPEELGAVSKGWQEKLRTTERREWERTRMLATLLLQPYSKKRLRPEDILSLKNEDKPMASSKKSTPGRMRELAERNAAHSLSESSS